MTTSCLDIRFDPSAALQRLDWLRQQGLAGATTPNPRKVLGAAVLPLTLLPGTAPLTHWLLRGGNTEVVRAALDRKLGEARADFVRIIRGRSDEMPLYELIAMHHRRPPLITPFSPLELAAVSGDAALSAEAIPMLIGVRLNLVRNQTATVVMDTFDDHHPPFDLPRLPFSSPDPFGPGFPSDWHSVQARHYSPTSRYDTEASYSLLTVTESQTRLLPGTMRTLHAWREITESFFPEDGGVAIPRVTRRVDAELKYNNGEREGSLIGLNIFLPKGDQEQQVMVYRRLVSEPHGLTQKSVDPAKAQVLFVPGHALFVSGWYYGLGGFQDFVSLCALVVQMARLELSRNRIGLIPKKELPFNPIEQEAIRMVREKKITVLKKDNRAMTLSLSFTYKGRKHYVIVDLNPQEKDPATIPVAWRLTFPSETPGTPPMVVSSKLVDRETLAPLQATLL